MKFSIAILLALSPLLAEGAVIVDIGSAPNDVAKAYDGGGAFATGVNPLSMGNINTLPTRQRGIIKFDISQFSGEFVSDAIFNFKVDYVNNTQGFTLPFQIDVYTLNYDKTSAAFVVDDLTTTDVTARGSYFVSTTGVASWDATEALQSAIDQGFDYLSLRFVNSTVQSGPFGTAAYIGLSTIPTNLSLAVTIPEPSAGLMLSLGMLALGLGGMLKRHGLLRCR